MLGLLHGLFLGGYGFYSSTMIQHDNSMNRREAEKNGKSFYIDNKGRAIDIHTGHVLFHKYNEYGEQIEVDLKTGRERNVGLQKKYDDFYKNRVTAKPGEMMIWRMDSKEALVRGAIYREYISGEYYVIRKFDSTCRYYMSVDTGILVRPTFNIDNADKFWKDRIVNTMEERNSIHESRKYDMSIKFSKYGSDVYGSDDFYWNAYK